MKVAFTDDFGYTSEVQEMTAEEMDRRNAELDAEGLGDAGHWHPVTGEEWNHYIILHAGHI